MITGQYGEYFTRVIVIFSEVLGFNVVYNRPMFTSDLTWESADLGTDEFGQRHSKPRRFLLVLNHVRSPMKFC